MHEMLTIVADVRGVCLSVCLSVTRLKSAAARAVYAACRVHGVIRRLWPLVLCMIDYVYVYSKCLPQPGVTMCSSVFDLLRCSDWYLFPGLAVCRGDNGAVRTHYQLRSSLVFHST